MALAFDDDDDYDDESLGGLYEDGHWIWDNDAKSLVFVSDLPPVAIETIVIPKVPPTGAVEFRDDIDLLEQMRYRRRYYRKLKPGEPDVITLQDVKDLAIFTAPITIMSPSLINILHLPTTDRFLRSLIFYVQYYLQIADEMSTRMAELDHKIRTPQCDLIEDEYRANLSDLRALVAKEYCTVLLGGADTRRYHHMGPEKKSKSLSHKGARLFETLVCMSVQIAWLALGRKCFNQIELELNRIFKSDVFNNVEHLLKTGGLAKKTSEERSVLLGRSLKYDGKLNMSSPLLNEVFCPRDIDYRMFSLGVTKFSNLSYRLRYMWQTIAGPEDKFEARGISLGILGMPRPRFDTMLHFIPLVQKDRSKSRGSLASMVSSKSTMKSGQGLPVKLFPDIYLPVDNDMGPITEEFPVEPLATEPCCEVQRRRWQKRLHRLTHTRTRSHCP